MPAKIIAAVYLGYGMSGIAICIVRGVCLYVFASNDGKNNFSGVMLYYIIAAAVLLISAPLYYVEQNNKFIQFYKKKA